MRIIEFVIFLIFFLIITILFFLNKKNVVYLKSDTDNFIYEVQNTDEKEKVVNLLARIRRDIFYLVNRLEMEKEEHPKMKPYIEQLVRNIQNVKIYETPLNTNHTSYTVNKGEKMAFCVRSKETGELHDYNLIMYVVLHEISHVACPELDHPPLFWEIFEFIAKQAIKYNLYKKIDFNSNPTDYCGMEIISSVV